MNLVGKILTVIIFVLSIIFMTMAMMTYATHQNWRVSATDLKTKLDTAKSENAKLASEKTDLETQLSEEKTNRDASLTKLSNELKLLKDQQEKREKALETTDKDKRQLVATLEAQQQELSRFRKEMDALRTAVDQARKDRDLHFNEVVKMTDELHQVVNEMSQLKTRNTELAADLAKMQNVMRHFNVDPNADVSLTPPDVKGQVTAVLGGGIVEISIGSDAGLRKGHKLEIYRTGSKGDAYVGRVEITKTEPDKAVGKIDPQFQKSDVVKGDRVATKLQ